MRHNYPISSQELNDAFTMAYGNLCYLLGYEDSDQNLCSGLYDFIELSGVAYMSSSSGIMHIGTNDAKYELGLDEYTTSERLIDYLKFDYILRKVNRYI